MSTLPQIQSTNYDEITGAINALFASNQMAMISIYDDAEGTKPTTDDAGTVIDNLQVTSVSITKSYIDSVTNQPVNASVTFSFSDNSLKVVDDEHVFYYKIFGCSFPVRRFN
jgi:hypothetical protein